MHSKVLFSSSRAKTHTRFTAFAALFLAVACHTDVPTRPTSTTTNQTRAIAVVGGDEQRGKAGEMLADPLVVRVTDATGTGLAGASVLFEITSGAGDLGGQCYGRDPTLARSVKTDPDGTASMTLQPTVLGRTTVTARLDGLPDPSVTFTTEATALVVVFWFGYWDVGFVGPCSSSGDVAVPVGSIVEWKIPVTDERYPVTYRIASTSTPPGAEGFDSGMMTSRDRFRFVPTVAGTWQYRDEVTGLIGTLSSR